MNKKIISIIMAIVLGVSTLSFSAFANNNNGNQQKWEKKEWQGKDKQGNFQKPENMIMGKITSISENSVTISLAEFKMPDANTTSNNNFTPPKRPANDNNGNKGKGNRPPRMATASNAMPPRFDRDSNNMPQMSEEQIAEMKKNLENMFTLTGETKTIDISSATFDDFGRRNNDTNNNQTTKTYKDFSVGDYITIELESSTSNKAKSVRSSNGFGRGRFDMRPNNKQNNN